MRDTNLRACSLHARGLWIEMICLMHDARPYGHLVVGEAAIDPPTLARIVGESPPRVKALLAELETKGVFKRTEAGVIYSPRMVRDGEIRRIRAEAGAKGGNPALLQKPKPTPPDDGEETPEVADLVNQTGNQNPTPSSASAVADVDGMSVRGATRSDATVRPDRPGEPPRDVVTGVVVGDIAAAAVLFTAAVNRGISETHGEQPLPLRHDAQHAYAERLLGAGVDVTWARDWLYHRAKHNTHADNLPGSLAYFVAWCTKAWRRRVAADVAKQQAAGFTPGADPEPARTLDTPGTAVALRDTGRATHPPARFPSAAERLSQRSRENTRVALAALRAERERSA
jgi:hypothetical protein